MTKFSLFLIRSNNLEELKTELEKQIYNTKEYKHRRKGSEVQLTTPSVWIASLATGSIAWFTAALNRC